MNERTNERTVTLRRYKVEVQETLTIVEITESLDTAIKNRSLTV